MSDLPKVSVHIITYNQENFAAEAIESAIAQDYTNLEVVVSDDASTDSTAAIVANYQRRYPDRVVAILNSVNGGVTRNSNRALRACTGKYIAFLGGDDVMLPGKISAQVAWLEKDPNRALCGHQVEVFYEAPGVRPHPLTRDLQAGKGAEHFIRHGAYGACSIMIRASKVPERGFEETLPVVSDQMMWAQVVADGSDYGFIPETLARYRRHRQNISSSLAKNIDEVSRYLELMEEQYPEYGDSYRYAYVRHVLYDLGVFFLVQGKKAEARVKFLEAVRKEPLFLKAWFRAAQSIW